MGRVTVSNNTQKVMKTHTRARTRTDKYLMRLHSSTSDFVTRDERESSHVKHGVNRPREAVMTPAEEELRGEKGGREQE